jgi:hypothetical protein
MSRTASRGAILSGGACLVAGLIGVVSQFACTTGTAADPHHTRLPELTAEQKAEDIRFFFSFTRESYPFLVAMQTEKGVNSFLDQEEDYVERAKTTTSHLEFMALFMELMQRVEQGTGHADVASPLVWTHDRELNDEIAQYGISLESFYIQREWWRLFNTIRQYSFSDIPIIYDQGNYVTTADYTVDAVSIPEGSIVLLINGQTADEYVLSCQHKTWLRFDRHLGKPYDSNGTPFVTYGAQDTTTWTVRFRLENGDTIDCELPKITDVTRAPVRPVPESNVVCLELSDEVGYIKVASFPGVAARRAEHKVIRRFITRAQDKYRKLILDLRRNSGGSPVYWEENLIPFLINEPVTYVQYAAVKKRIFDRLEGPFRSTRSRVRSSYDSGQFRLVMREELPWANLPSYFHDSDWYFFEVRRSYAPAEGVRLACQVFVLTDNDSFSATEDLVKTIKQLQLATLVGARSCGGAAAFLEPWLFELPNSHIIFLLEVELAFNPDGGINEIHGTIPDFELEPSKYPTSYPSGFSKEDLLEDSWIQWVISQ